MGGLLLAAVAMSRLRHATVPCSGLFHLSAHMYATSPPRLVPASAAREIKLFLYAICLQFYCDWWLRYEILIEGMLLVRGWGLRSGTNRGRKFDAA